ncbi:MAG: hypothetical protein HQK70_10675 [Desulfamplus sp.]|nr:hypothetical protein [Desulfamplus sp.]
MMKKFKLTLGLFVVIFVILLIYQNRAYFFAKQTLSFILVPEKFQWTAPAVENLAYFGGCLVIGILITGYLGLVAKLRSRKTIKQLNSTIISQTETINALQSELDTFKQTSYIEDDLDDIATTDEGLLTNSKQPASEPMMIEESIDVKDVIATNEITEQAVKQPVNINKA